MNQELKVMVITWHSRLTLTISIVNQHQFSSRSFP